MTDTELLEALEREVTNNGSLVLWNKRTENGTFPGGLRGLSFDPPEHTLRMALESCLRYVAKPKGGR